jgi:ketosteroid isomerase-like protein
VTTPRGDRLKWTMRVFRPLPVLIAIGLALPALASQGSASGASESLARARELYRSAHYEQALEALAAVDAPADLDQADLYRALCFLALGRVPDVRRTLETLLARNPAFEATGEEIPPRMSGLLDDTRREILPDVLRGRFTDARGAYDRGDHADASARFTALLEVLQGLRQPLANHAPLVADLQTLTEAYLSLIRSAAAGAPRGGPAPPSPQALEMEAVAQLLAEYADAYSALDAASVARIFPGIDERALQRAFDALRSQVIEVRDVRITFDAEGPGARVLLTWVVDAVPRAGAPIHAQLPVTLRLSKTPGGEWTIVERR